MARQAVNGRHPIMMDLTLLSMVYSHHRPGLYIIRGKHHAPAGMPVLDVHGTCRRQRAQLRNSFEILLWLFYSGGFGKLLLFHAEGGWLRTRISRVNVVSNHSERPFLHRYRMPPHRQGVLLTLAGVIDGELARSHQSTLLEPSRLQYINIFVRVNDMAAYPVSGSGRRLGDRVAEYRKSVLR